MSTEKPHGFKKADRVAVEICIGCAICRYCRKGLVNPAEGSVDNLFAGKVEELI